MSEVKYRVDKDAPISVRSKIPKEIIDTFTALQPGESLFVQNVKPMSLRTKLKLKGFKFSGRKETGGYRIWKI